MLLAFLIIGALIGWAMSARDGESALRGTVIGGVGGVLGGVAFLIVLRLLGLFAGALGAAAGAYAILWLFNRWMDR